MEICPQDKRVSLEIRFDDDLNCIYFKSWEMTE